MGNTTPRWRQWFLNFVMINRTELVPLILISRKKNCDLFLTQRELANNLIIFLTTWKRLHFTNPYVFCFYLENCTENNTSHPPCLLEITFIYNKISTARTRETWSLPELCSQTFIGLRSTGLTPEVRVCVQL